MKFMNLKKQRVKGVKMLVNKRSILYLICTIISLISFNKIDKTILFMAVLYLIYKIINKKRIYLEIYNK